MGYIQDIERELRDMLRELPADTIETAVKFVKDKIYQSYKNGLNGKGSEKATQPQPAHSCS